MASERRLLCSLLSLCLILATVLSLVGCEDLGDFEDTDEYYASFGDIYLIEGTKVDDEYPAEEYSVEDYFYNESSREDFLEVDGNYVGVPIKDYVYMAIPFNSDIRVDSLALYMRGSESALLHVSLFLTDTVPENIRGIADPGTEVVEENGEQIDRPIDYDDPAIEQILANVPVSVNAKNWTSFVIDSFASDGQSAKYIDVKSGQYLLILFRDNSDAYTIIAEDGGRTDAITGDALTRRNFTMTNLLIRALDPDEANGKLQITEE